jgi:hypothetical protein
MHQWFNAWHWGQIEVLMLPVLIFATVVLQAGLSGHRVVGQLRDIMRLAKLP